MFHFLTLSVFKMRGINVNIVFVWTIIFTIYLFTGTYLFCVDFFAAFFTVTFIYQFFYTYLFYLTFVVAKFAWYDLKLKT